MDIKYRMNVGILNKKLTTQEDSLRHWIKLSFSVFSGLTRPSCCCDAEMDKAGGG